MSDDIYTLRADLSSERERRVLLERKIVQMERSAESHALESDHACKQHDAERQLWKMEREATERTFHDIRRQLAEATAELQPEREGRKEALQRCQFVLQDNERWKSEVASMQRRMDSRAQELEVALAAQRQAEETAEQSAKALAIALGELTTLRASLKEHEVSFGLAETNIMELRTSREHQALVTQEKVSRMSLYVLEAASWPPANLTAGSMLRVERVVLEPPPPPPLAVHPPFDVVAELRRLLAVSQLELERERESTMHLQTQLDHRAEEAERERAMSNELRDSLRRLRLPVATAMKESKLSPVGAAGGDERRSHYHSHLHPSQSDDGEPPSSPSSSSIMEEIARANEIAQLKVVLNRQVARTRELEVHETKLQCQLRDATDECAKLNHECDVLTATVRRCQGDLRTISGQRSGVEAMSHTSSLILQNILDEREAELAAAKSRLSASSAMERQLQTDLSTAVAKVDELEAKVSVLASRAAAWEELAALKPKYETMVHESAVVKAANSRLEARLADMSASTVPAVVHREEVAAMQAELTARDHRIESLERRVSTDAEVKRKLAEGADALSASNDRIRELQAEVQRHLSTIETTQSNHHAQMVHYEKQLSANANEIASLRLHVQASQQRLLQVTLSHRQDGDDRRKDDEARRSETQAAAERLIAAAERIDALGAQAQSLQDENFRLRQQLTDVSSNAPASREQSTSGHRLTIHDVHQQRRGASPRASVLSAGRTFL